MVSDNFGQVRMRTIEEEHVSVSEEPSGKYLTHFVPEEPVHQEKPALKTAQALYNVLEQFNSVESLLFRSCKETVPTQTLDGKVALMPTWRRLLEENSFGLFAIFTPMSFHYATLFRLLMDQLHLTRVSVGLCAPSCPRWTR